MQSFFWNKVIHKRASRMGDAPHILERVQWTWPHIHKRASEKGVRALLLPIVEILFPISCVGCTTPRTPLCASCARSISPPEYSDTIIAPWSFKDPRVRTLIHQIKYRARTVVSNVCAKALAERLTEEISDRMLYETFLDPLVVPVPLHPRRKHARGYNQAELLARAVTSTAQFHCVYTHNVLERIKDTPAQARIKDKRERLRNIVGAFAVHNLAREQIAGKDIILIDDVATTGATLREAARVLKEAGAREVLLAAVAH